MSSQKPANLATYEIALRKEREHTQLIAAAKRKEVQAAGGNCLLCKHTRLAVGKRLICKLKDKLVTQFNYCDKFIELSVETNGDNDD